MASIRRQATLDTLGEHRLIQSIPPQFSQSSLPPTIGRGDDAAVLALPSSHQAVVSTDLLIENIHFSIKTATFYDIGYKAAAANLSDMAAMGAIPSAIFVAIACPPSLKHNDWKNFYRGLAKPCRAFDVELLGGDTSASSTSLFIAVTVLGHIKPGHILTRHGAKTGDLIYVSGTLGDSKAGLTFLKKYKHPPNLSTFSQSTKFLAQRHLHPTPQIRLGQLLASRPFASSAIDLSDGLSGDLRHLCQQSGVGALIYEEHIPMSLQMRSYAKRVRAIPLQWALHGGEDYELLFTLPPQWQQTVEKRARTHRIPITQIGVIQPLRFGIRIERHDHIQERLTQRSYEHFSS